MNNLSGLSVADPSTIVLVSEGERCLYLIPAGGYLTANRWLRKFPDVFDTAKLLGELVGDFSDYRIRFVPNNVSEIGG